MAIGPLAHCWCNRLTGPSGFSYLKTGDSESAKMIENPEYIRNGIHQLKSRNKLYIIGQLGNSVSTSGKKITEEYANSNNMSYEYYNYLDIAKKFSELRPEKVFKLNTANFIDGWGGLWNENPCEKQITFDTMVKVVEQSQTIEKLKFVIGLRTEIGKELERRGIQMEEHEKLLLDCSSIYKREKVKEEIEVLQNSCSNEKCGCKSLTYERVSGINQVPIGNYLVVRLMSLDHTMILDFLMREVGPLEAMRNHFEKLMEEGQIWQWLPYFVCLGYYDKDQFRHDIADGFNISQSMFLHCESIAKYIKPKKELAPLWSTRFCCDPHVKKQDNNPSDVVVFWHTFLYICAFHACFKKYPKQMLRFCNLDAILQLVRPKDYHDPLTIVADDKEVDFFYNERLKNRAIVSSLSEHPLVKERRNRRKSRGIKTLFKKHA
ncbi:uncharacterized protein LOC133197856 [Saccostrea echinata]|uniref:uncharacterized protein LOC133197856 n=1 Tax=Saccostrea echinata TaxID=191078 RepID=UPI002A8303F1|nr:uncharacterized protein LOC133197856 [Saccostrea echinata]